MEVPSIRTTALVCLRSSEISAPSFLAILSAESAVSRLRPGNVCAENPALLRSVWPQVVLPEEHVEGL